LRVRPHPPAPPRGEALKRPKKGFLRGFPYFPRSKWVKTPLFGRFRVVFGLFQALYGQNGPFLGGFWVVFGGFWVENHLETGYTPRNGWFRDPLVPPVQDLLFHRVLPRTPLKSGPKPPSRGRFHHITCEKHDRNGVYTQKRVVSGPFGFTRTGPSIS
jgi:hypothetical protein